MKRPVVASNLSALPYEALLAGSLQGVLIVAAGEIVLANAAAAGLFAARNPEQLAGRALSELLAPEDVQRLAAAAPARGKARQARPLQATALDGRALSLQVAAHSVPWPPGQALQLTVLDRTELNEARAALAAREEQFRHLIEGSLQGIYVHDEHRLLFVNRALAEIFGYESPEDVLAMGDALQFYAPDERERLTGYYRARQRGESAPVRYEFQGLRKDGSTAWLENLVRVVTWQGREAVQATVIDISERKRAERGLRASEQRYRDVVEGSIMGIMIQRGRKALFANQACAELFGYDSPEDLYALDDLEVLAAEDFRETMRGYAQSRLRGEPAPQRYVGHARRRDGADLWLDTSVRVVDWDGEPAIQTAAIDVTERVRAERDLQAHQRLLQTVFDTIPHSLYVKDTSSRYQMVNRAFCDAVALPPERIVGRTLEEIGFASAFQREAVHAADRVVLESGRPQLIEDAELTLPDGERTRRHIIKYPLFGENDEVIGMVGITEDVTERLNAEERMRASERLMRMVLDHLPYLVFVKDREGRFKFVNAAFAAFQRIPPEQCVGRTVEQLRFGEAPVEMLLETDRQVLQAGEIVDVPEVRLAPLDGPVGIYHLQKLPLQDDSGAIIGLVGLCEEITGRIRSEQEVRASQRLLSTVINTLPHAIYVRDREGRYRVVNAAMAQHLGLPAEQLLGRTMRELGPWTPQRQQLAQADERVLSEGCVVDMAEMELADAQGRATIRHVVKIPLLDDAGDVTGVVGVSEDITERRRAEAELHSSRTLLTTVFDLLPLWVFVKDRQRRFLMINCQMARDYAITDDVEPGSRLDLGTSITEEERSVIYDLDQRVLDSGELVEVPEVQITLPQGGTRLFRTVRMPLRDAAGAVTGIVGIAEDITERRRTEQAIQQAQKLESLGVLAGGVAHDFNNLLVSILGNASLAMLDLPPDSPAMPSLAQVETAGQRAAELCRQLLAYSGKGSFEIASVNLNELIAEMTQLLHVSLAKSITLTYEFAADLPAVEVDPTQIRQVVMNLVMNAAEAIGQQPGSITVTTSDVHVDHAALLSYVQGDPLPEGRCVLLEVRDSGVGIPPEMLGRIFDPFFSTKFAGRGLGLAAVLGIVRGHQGALQVISQPGEGSTFRMLLPAQGGAADSAEHPLAGIRWRGEGTALIVDDESEVREVLERMMASLGFTVIAVPDGQQALAQVRERAVRIVVLAVTLPGPTARETLRRLREHDGDLPVALVSGDTEEELAGHFAGLGVGAVLQKPFTLQALATRLEALLG